MPAENDVYDRAASEWWDERGFLHVLHAVVNPARVAYFRQVLEAELGRHLPALRVLDVGCGGGSLSEAFARLGCRVVGVDPSAPSIAVAADHAAAQALPIAYAVGAGERLPFPPAAFDAVLCGDVLEHVADPEQVLAEIARVLRPGGPFLYDTPNRTVASRVALIWLAERWRPTRLAPPGFHDWRAFLRPDELETAMRRHGIEPRGRTGLALQAAPVAVLRAALGVKRGTLSVAEAGQLVPLQRSRTEAFAYMGYGLKAARSDPEPG